MELYGTNSGRDVKGASLLATWLTGCTMEMRYYTAYELARLAMIDYRLVRALIASGQLVPVGRVGTRAIFAESALDALKNK